MVHWIWMGQGVLSLIAVRDDWWGRGDPLQNHEAWPTGIFISVWTSEHTQNRSDTKPIESIGHWSQCTLSIFSLPRITARASLPVYRWFSREEILLLTHLIYKSLRSSQDISELSSNGICWDPTSGSACKDSLDRRGSWFCVWVKIVIHTTGMSLVFRRRGFPSKNR